MPIYISSQQPIIGAEKAVHIATAGSDRTGPRLQFQSHSNWLLIPGAGKMAEADENTPGIYTAGQLQCMAVIAAKFNANGSWKSCRLAHISSGKHSLLDKMEQEYIDAETYMVIGAKPGSLGWMKIIRDRFVNTVKNVWIYVGDVKGVKSPDFGMNQAGYFGETVSWVRAV